MSHDPATAAALESGHELLDALQRHLAALDSEDGPSDDLDQELWDSVAAYGDALDELYGDIDDEVEEEPDEIRFTVRARYDYTVVDEKAVLEGSGGLGAAVAALLQKGGRPLRGLEVDALETGSGLVTVHLNNEPLTATDFDADDSTDLLLVDPAEELSVVLAEPVYDTRAEAEAAAKR